jgi:hypothetical protein
MIARPIMAGQRFRGELLARIGLSQEQAAFQVRLLPPLIRTKTIF